MAGRRELGPCAICGRPMIDGPKTGAEVEAVVKKPLELPQPLKDRMADATDPKNAEMTKVKRSSKAAERRRRGLSPRSFGTAGGDRLPAVSERLKNIDSTQPKRYAAVVKKAGGRTAFFTYVTEN